MPNRPTPGLLEERSQPLAVDGRRIRGVIPFGVESVDMGGWREVIESRALDGADLSDVTLKLEHAGIPLARYPGTMDLEQRSDGVHWSATPPESRQDVVEAISRGDLRSTSFRMKVARDSWDGDVRHVHEISALRDVSLTSSPAYPSASVELRSHNETEEGPVPEVETVAPVTPEVVSPAAVEETRSVPVPVVEEVRAAAGSLRVQDRSGGEQVRGLADEFRALGFPNEAATMSWESYESRAVTWSASVNVMNQVRREGVPLGQDVRYAWPAFGRVGVGPEVTSVAVVQQTARALAAAASVIRAIDAVTTKPETGSTINLATIPLQQVANVQSNIPNTYLQQPAVNSIIEQDLRLAINEALDLLVITALAGAGFQAPGTDPLVGSIRKAITGLRTAGYAPDTLLLTPAADEALDLLVSGIAGGVADYIFAPGQFGPSIFGLNRRVSKSLPAPVVVDSAALGKLYASPVTLAKFEGNQGLTNTANIRLELNAAFGTERIAAATRIASA
jgi:phage head maturation protease